MKDIFEDSKPDPGGDADPELDPNLEPEEENALAILIAGRMASRNYRGLPPRRLIRCLRRGAGLSQGAVARRAGMRQSRVSEIESARVEPRWGEIRDLLAAMGCEPVLLATRAGYQLAIPEDEARPIRPPYW